MGRSQRFFLGLSGGLLGLLLGISVSGCLASAFDLPTSLLGILILVCGIFAATASLCYSLRLGLLPPVITVFAFIGAWKHMGLSLSLEAAVYRISDSLGKTYGFDTLTFTQRTLDGVDCTPALCAVSALVVLGVVWTVCRRKNVLFAIAGTLVPALPCFLIRNRVPDPLWLFFLLLGLSVLVLSHPLCRRHPARAPALQGMLLIPTALMLALLFAFLPQEGYERKEQYVNPITLYMDHYRQQQSQAGLSSKSRVINLRHTGPLQLGDAPVMEVTFSDDQALYLRGHSYDIYTGTGWESSGSAEELPWLVAPFFTSEETVSIRTFEPLLTRFVPYYLSQQEMTGAQETMSNPDGATVFKYNLPVTQEFAELFAADWELTSTESRYQQLPEHTAAWATPFVQNIISGHSPSYQLLLIKRYVRQVAPYDLQTPHMPTDRKDFALWFLQDAPSGYCVHYATAAAVLLRAAGFNARYVTGYLVTPKAGKAVTVLEKHAHAWVEYYDPSMGWMIFDATGLADQQVSVGPSQPEPTMPPENTPENEPKPTQPSTLPTEPTSTEAQPTVPGPSEEKQASPLILLWLLLIPASILAQWQLRLFLRRRKKSIGSINKQAVVAYAELERLCRLSGSSPDPLLLALAQKARFSQHTLTRQELSEFESAIREQLQKLRALPLHKRLLHRLIYAAY